jgi:glutathione synthase/RimK-type ligase-like ATP-grasp enzyme
MKEEDFALLHHLQHAPAIFQAVVAGARDVRVTVVGDQVFASEFDIEQMNHIDYRVALNEITCRPHELSPSFVKQILRFMDTLGLEYGGLDFRLTRDGRYVFFEINPDGEFIYLEDRTGQPIAAAMANHLRTGKPARPARHQAGGANARKLP